METAQVAETARQADREFRTADASTPEMSPTTTEKVITVSFLIAVLLFGLISVIDLVSSLFR
jgi:hypothetical protein